ncbi:hypothetical protein ACIG3E_23325 [Streptomyces sp. NPDC053474]
MINESAFRATMVKHPHTWVVAAEIVVEESVARLADFRGSFRTQSQ